MQVLVLFSVFTNYMGNNGNNLLELSSKMMKFANPIKLFRAMKKKQTRRYAFMKCVISLDFTVWDTVSAETVYSSEMANINSESCRNISAKCHSVLDLFFHRGLAFRHSWTQGSLLHELAVLTHFS